MDPVRHPGVPRPGDHTVKGGGGNVWPALTSLGYLLVSSSCNAGYAGVIGCLEIRLDIKKAISPNKHITKSVEKCVTNIATLLPLS